ncbi:hypothetical protein [Vulcanisaeta sp. JCM 16159]|uniref:hypothetical protein n=1 Tax=Vulcanisaeta sp. JCM 16159 TaxID=1295371 RepID=UPI0006CFCA5E|nr:hypothetical protein [Vulcanisaeta sp. JCM 16159]
MRNSRAKVLISGEPFDGNKSFMAHLYTENLAITINRVAKSGSITITLYLTGLEGFRVITPKLLDDGKLRATQYGLLLTDGSIHKRATQRWVLTSSGKPSPGSLRGLGGTTCTLMA